jgi:60 kDa SS-A/Ro ribonucleoprotein
MARFNRKDTPATVVNRAGGQAYTESDKLNFVSILLTSFVKDQYYRKGEEAQSELTELVGKVDPLFAAKAAVYARHVYGMRSVSHIVAAELARIARGKPWIRSFYAALPRRVDDITEILALYLGKYGKPLPNSLKYGLARAYARFDNYQLAKYRAEGKAVSLVDAVNLQHPKPVAQNQTALAALVKDELVSTETWESKLSSAGSQGTTEAEVDELKAQAWGQLLAEKKLGVFAALRNARNILEQAPEAVDALCELLTNETAIRKSLILPFRFYVAYKEISKTNYAGSRKVLMALNRAVDIALANIPQLLGNTLVVMDVSGSMTQAVNAMGDKGSSYTAAEIAALFSSVLIKATGADFLTFANDARYVMVNTNDSTLTLTELIMSRATGGGTNFHCIFEALRKPYDRVVLLSDMQGWVGYESPTKEFAAYRVRTKANPHIYSWDLAGYGTLMFPEQNVYALAGFSDKVMSIMGLLESDRQALVQEIEKVSFLAPPKAQEPKEATTEEPS